MKVNQLKDGAKLEPNLSKFLLEFTETRPLCVIGESRRYPYPELERDKKIIFNEEAPSVPPKPGKPQNPKISAKKNISLIAFPLSRCKECGCGGPISRNFVVAVF